MAELAQLYPVALVTGVSSGLGYAFARMLMDEGVHVVGLSRQPEVFVGDSLYEAVSCDLTDSAALEGVLKAVFEQWPDTGLVVNNAGFGILERLSSMDSRAIQQQYAVMLESPTLIAAAALAHYHAQGVRGCLVNVSSLAVELPLPLMSVYNACKSGLSALSESLILEDLDERSTVIDFRPGDFNTGFAERMSGSTTWNGVNLREVMDHHHAIAPDVSLAVRSLRWALLRQRSGTVRVGDWFQARVAPWGRLLPACILRKLIRWYYTR